MSRAPRVMIIDDNHDAAEVTAMLVEDMGGVPRTANDGASGIAALREFDAHVVLLDIGMPLMDGYETCRRIRQEHGAALTIIALTGWGQDQDKNRTQQAGFDAHLTKPADPAKLQDMIRDAAARADRESPPRR